MRNLMILFLSVIIAIYSFAQSSNPETQVFYTDTGDVVLEMEPNAAKVVKDTVVNGEEILEQSDGTYWKKGRPNFIFLIVPLLIVAAPIIILRYRKK